MAMLLPAWRNAEAAAGRGRRKLDDKHKIKLKDETKDNYRKHNFSDFWHELVENSTWSSRSLFIFPVTSRIRKLAISLTHTAEWRGLVQLLIFANCVNMMMYDPLQPDSPFNRLLEQVEVGFTAAFTVELMVKVLASGLVVPDPNSGQYVSVYFRGTRDIWLTLTCRAPHTKDVSLEPACMLRLQDPPLRQGLGSHAYTAAIS